jgi:hypothetical protein
MKDNAMSNIGKAVVFGAIAGGASIAIYVSTTQHIAILAPYIALMSGVAAWMFRQRIARFWSRVTIALTAFAVTTLMLWAFDMARSLGQVTIVGVLAGLGRTFLIGIAVSVVSALLSWRPRGGQSIDLHHASNAPR